MTELEGKQSSLLFVFLNKLEDLILRIIYIFSPVVNNLFKNLWHVGVILQAFGRKKEFRANFPPKVVVCNKVISAKTSCLLSVN